MVSTRSHNHTPATSGKESANDNGIDHMASGKRKIQHDADSVTPSQPAAKRRRAVEKLKSDIASSPQIATAVVIEVGRQDGHGMWKQEVLEPQTDTPSPKVTGKQSPPSTRSPRPRSRESDAHTNTPTTESVSVDLEQDDAQRTSDKDNAGPGQLPASSNATKNLKESDKVNNPITEDDTNEEPSPESTDEIKTTIPPPNPPKSTHKRFDSVEPEPFQPLPQDAKQDEVTLSDNPSDIDDDEAPETVTASSGQAHALTAVLEQAKAAAGLKRERKLKRQERDVKLKKQAKSAKRAHKADLARKSSKPNGAVDEAIDTPTPSANAQAPHKAKQPLPALLPDHILAEEPPIRPLIPLPPSTGKIFTPSKKRFLDLKQKPPKDIKKGRVNIRILQEGSGILPPKASRQGKALREAWLMGRRGKGSLVERRKMRGQGGFVRR